MLYKNIFIILPMKKQIKNNLWKVYKLFFLEYNFYRKWFWDIILYDKPHSEGKYYECWEKRKACGYLLKAYRDLSVRFSIQGSLSYAYPKLQIKPLYGETLFFCAREGIQIYKENSEKEYYLISPSVYTWILWLLLLFLKHSFCVCVTLFNHLLQWRLFLFWCVV